MFREREFQSRYTYETRGVISAISAVIFATHAVKNVIQTRRSRWNLIKQKIYSKLCFSLVFRQNFSSDYSINI